MATQVESLADRKCAPCREGTPPIKGRQLERLHEQIKDWKVIDDRRLEKEFRFPNFVKALEFVNRVGRLAEEENHHPLIHLTWGRATIELWTHKINGLSENDFILAAKIDRL